MGFSRLRAALLGLPVLASATSTTISLSNFIPRIDNLPPQCAAVYTSKIDGCVAADFVVTAGSTSVCSAACTQGLTKMQDAVQRGCAGVDAGESSLIGVFQNGLGLQALCPGVTTTTSKSNARPSTSTQVAVETSTEPSATATSFQMILSTSVASAPTSAAEDAPSSSMPTGGSDVDPSSTRKPPTPSTATSTAGVTPPNSQLSNAGSGGGSPFDVVAVGSSPRLRISDITTASFIVAVVLSVAWM